MDSLLFRSQIENCQAACIFRNAKFPPIAPSIVKVPVELMFIGENPSWADNQQQPFDPSTISGQALDKNYLRPLGLNRDQVWITDLIKCRYLRDGENNIYHNKAKYKNEIQSVSELCFNKWLIKEVEFAKPKIIVTLSNVEVYQRIRKIMHLETPTDFNEAVGKGFIIVFGDHECILFPMIHPDISRPNGEGDRRKLKVREKWAPKHIQHIKRIAVLLNCQS